MWAVLLIYAWRLSSLSFWLLWLSLLLSLMSSLLCRLAWLSNFIFFAWCSNVFHLNSWNRACTALRNQRGSIFPGAGRVTTKAALCLGSCQDPKIGDSRTTICNGQSARLGTRSASAGMDLSTPYLSGDVFISMQRTCLKAGNPVLTPLLRACKKCQSSKQKAKKWQTHFTCLCQRHARH